MHRSGDVKVQAQGVGTLRSPYTDPGSGDVKVQTQGVGTLRYRPREWGR